MNRLIELMEKEKALMDQPNGFSGSRDKPGSRNIPTSSSSNSEGTSSRFLVKANGVSQAIENLRNTEIQKKISRENPDVMEQ